MKVAGMMVDQFALWGYPAWFQYLIGVVEALAGVGFLLGRMRFMAAVVVVPIMAGAIFTLVRAGTAPQAAVPTVALLLRALRGEEVALAALPRPPAPAWPDVPAGTRPRLRACRWSPAPGLRRAEPQRHAGCRVRLARRRRAGHPDRRLWEFSSRPGRGSRSTAHRRSGCRSARSRREARSAAPRCGRSSPRPASRWPALPPGRPCSRSGLPACGASPPNRDRPIGRGRRCRRPKPCS
ncbi:MAG: DoxX family protein [Gemmatimonadales bacterium]|nr:DoxX family protein [Gemmatimonadales bacterium]MYG20528.1 DoxX family protein [Gemmatimonadales bacterium]